MKTATLLWVTLVILLNFVKLSEIYKEYDNPSTEAYQELKEDFERFLVEIIRANFQRPSSARLLLRKKDKSCEGRCHDTRDLKSLCHCDDRCSLYRDCCVDYWKQCNVTSKPYNTSTQKQWQCTDTTYRTPQPNNKSAPHIPISYMMITRCPSTTPNTTTTAECFREAPRTMTEISDTSPVTGDDGRVYVNRGCAHCHGVESVKIWRFGISCPKNLTNNVTRLRYDSEILQNNCTWYFVPPNATESPPDLCKLTRPCTNTTTTTITKYTDLANKCQVYMQLIYNGGYVYKNFHCATCHGVKAIEFEMPPISQTLLPTLNVFFEYPSGDDVTGNDAGDDDDVIGGYLTTVGLSLSIACLAMVIVTYVWFPKLRTVPGLVLLSLSAALLIYQALLLATIAVTSRTDACKAIAILLHFFLISAFTWMTIMSYDVTRTFAVQGQSSGRVASKSSFRRYLVAGVVIPVVIVKVPLILNEADAMNVAYGNSASCWIGQLLPLIIFFHVPVGIMLLFNAVALIWTISSIRKVTKLTKNVQKSVSRDPRSQNVKIYSKLSTVMGVTWFLGFAVSYSSVVSYIYIIVNSLQGVFIFITFVLNKRTMNLWRHSASTRGATTITTRASKKTTASTRKSLSPSVIQLQDK